MKQRGAGGSRICQLSLLQRVCCFEKMGEIKIEYLSSLLVLKERWGKGGNVHVLFFF